MRILGFIWITRKRLEQIKKTAWDEGFNTGYKLGKMETHGKLVEEAERIVRDANDHFGY